MKKTTNYNLNVPELTDAPPDITKISANYNVIDTELKKVSDAADGKVAKAGDTMSGKLTVSTPTTESIKIAGAGNGSHRDLVFGDASNGIIASIAGKNNGNNGAPHALALDVCDSNNVAKGGINISYDEENNRLIVTLGNSPVTNANDKEVVTAEWVRRQNYVNQSVVVGSVMAFAGSTTPNNYLFCDGSLINRSEYPELFAVIGTIYGEGDGSTTFALPNLVDRFVQGNSVSGVVHNPGLPNIEGIFPGPGTSSSYSSTILDGAFYVDKVKKGVVVANSGDDDNVYGFDASRSNSVYGASETVQPPAITMRYIIKCR